MEIFGEGNFFLELVDRPEIAEQETINAQLIDLGRADARAHILEGFRIALANLEVVRC